MDFDICDLTIQGVKLISPFYIEDERGGFLKNFEKDIFTRWGSMLIFMKRLKLFLNEM